MKLAKVLFDLAMTITADAFPDEVNLDRWQYEVAIVDEWDHTKGPVPTDHRWVEITARRPAALTEYLLVTRGSPEGELLACVGYVRKYSYRRTKAGRMIKAMDPWTKLFSDKRCKN